MPFANQFNRVVPIILNKIGDSDESNYEKQGAKLDIPFLFDLGYIRIS